jgi:ABC-type nickel/cobalt efflux system permease component RcnA
MLNTKQGVGVLLLLAVLFGAAHALTPGHGKTLVAAYLVGERGTVWHALLLGLVTTLTHTAAVLVIAGVLPLLFPGTPPVTVQTALGLVGGLLIAGLGVWLLLCRLAGQADHVHLGGAHTHGHAHGHGHDHDHGLDSSGVAKPGMWGLVMLGVSGGIVPCWDAVAILGWSISVQRLWLALPLLLAFSAGLAGVLVVLGVSVVLARKAVDARWGETARMQRVARALPILSAVLIAGMGLWLCYSAVQAPH